jgi:8-oxo-dGTP pyrophosphatase MutT (NUDIX family)
MNPGLWSPVAGRVEGRLSPEGQAYKEIYEETGIQKRQLLLVRRGEEYTLKVNPSVQASVQPFLFQSETRRVRLNWENTDCKWVNLAHLFRFKLIPKFHLTLRSLKLL